MKLRQNFPHLDLAHRFKVSQAVVSNVLFTWINVLHEILDKQFMASRKKNKSCLLNCFSTFTNCSGLTNLKNPLIKQVEEKYSDQSEQSESET
jgi:hypothetical protein